MLVLWISAVLATGIQADVIPCPIDGTPIRRFHKAHANNHGGFDSDGASYSTEGQFRDHAIASCSVDLFSVYGTHLTVPIPPERLPTLRAALAEERATLSDQQKPPVWERYGIAARMYRELGHPALFLAEVYLDASWAARDAAVGVYVGGLNGPMAANTILETGERELTKQLPIADQKTVLYNMARVAHRAGYGERRDGYLLAFEALGPLEPAETKAVQRFRHITHVVEPKYQDLAIAALREGLAERTVSSDEIASATLKAQEKILRAIKAQGGVRTTAQAK